MSFIETVQRAADLLRQQGRISLRALSLEFALDDGQLDALIDELVNVLRLATHEGKSIAWIPAPAHNSASVDAAPAGAEIGRADTEGIARSESEAERRQLTVLFCDLVDSTRLAAEMDPEDWRNVVRGYQKAAAAVVERFEGHVAQYLGDGILAYFGWPRAHEDDAERAVRAGLGILEALAADGEPLSVRIGIHTGPVVVGEMGGGASRETLAMGDTPNVAARLQSAAVPDSLVLSAATLHLVQGVFLTDALGEFALKGIGRPISAHRALRASGVRSRLDVAVAGTLTPLVGREGELDLLKDRFGQVCEGVGQAVAVSGEAGIGKSRIIQAFRERLVETRHTWIECRCSAYTRDSAFLPIIDLLHQALSIPADAPTEAKLAQTKDALSYLDIDVADALPLVANLLSLPLPEGYPAQTLTAEARRLRTMELLEEWLLRLGLEQPLVLFAEDLHWVDPSTLELLARIVDKASTASILALYTYRPDFHAPWEGRSHVTQILLQRVTRNQAQEIVRGAARGREVPDEWVEEITRRTDGVPLFVEELTRTLADSNALDHQGGVKDVLAAVSIPETLQDSLNARLDQLGPVKEVAQLAACLGREFKFQLLLAVRPPGAEDLTSALARAVDAEVLYQRGVPPDATYVFKHALIQEAAYASLLRSSRERHHRRIAETLEEHFPSTVETQPELVARHYAGAGEVSKAVVHLNRAGQRAIERSAQNEAVQLLRLALELLAELPDSGERRVSELGLQTLLGMALLATEGYGTVDVGRTFERAQTICRELGDSEALFPVLFGHWAFHMARAETDAELASAGQLLALSERSDDTGHKIIANVAMGSTLFWRGEFRRSGEHCERVLALYDPARHAGLAVIYGQNPAAYAAGILSHDLWSAGLPDRARAMGERALALAEDAEHPFTLAGVLSTYSAQLSLALGEPAQALAIQERAHAICEENGFSLFRGVSEFHRARVLGVLGEPGALQGMENGMDSYRVTGTLVGNAQLHALMAEECLRLKKSNEGIAALEVAGALAEKHDERFWDPEIHRLRGELLLLGDGVGADWCFETAMERASAQGAHSFELRAAMSLARLRQRQGRPGDARIALQPVYDWFTEGFDTLDLKEAKALLDELG